MLREVLLRRLPPLVPSSDWAGGDMHNANPINKAIRHILPQSLRNGIHVLELFVGIGLGVLRAAVATGFIIRCYTYVDKDRVSRRIARFVLLGLQRQFPL